MALYSLPSHQPSIARCSRCSRPLTDPESIRRGIGPECRNLAGGSAESTLCKRDKFSDQFDNAIPFSRALVMRRGLRPIAGGEERHGAPVTNVPHLVVHHSPNGYEFGYGGSGPADLALNACQLYLNMTGYTGKETKCYDGTCWSLAFALHQDFKDHFIASTPRTGKMIPFGEIDAWFKRHITSEMLEQYSLHTDKE